MPQAGTPGPTGPGVTYIMRAGDTDYYKVGFTRGSVDRRLRELQSGCPLPLRIVRVIKGRHHETRLHRLWVTERIRGEWFHLPELDVGNV